MNEDHARACIATIDEAILGLPAHLHEDGRAALTTLTRSFADLVRTLALGPAPERRSCPTCGHTGMRAATLCGYCWTKLTPPPSTGPGSTPA